MPATRERKPYARPARTPEQIEYDRQTRKAMKAARVGKIYANSKPLYADVGIVAGTTPRGRTHIDDVTQSVHHGRAQDMQLKRDLHRLAHVMSDKPIEYETVPEQAGWNDWSRSWWRQAVPSHPSAQRSNPIMKTRSRGERETFVKHRARNQGLQAPVHP
jgi:hypothetical protein